MNTDIDRSSDSPKLHQEVQRLARLYVEAGKYTLAEKLTMLLSAVFICTIGTLLGLGILVYLSLCLVHILADFIALEWAYLILAGAMALLSALIWLLREKIVYNPVARFVSRLIIESPNK